MEFRDALGMLIEAAAAQADTLRGLIHAAHGTEERETYETELAEIEEALTAGRDYLERTPT